MTTASYVDPNEDFVFHGIPLLAQLLPMFEGQPGMTYFQVCAENVKKAQNFRFNDGSRWVEVYGSVVYTIVGPAGRADMRLYCHGTPIRGCAPQSSVRPCVVDNGVENKTGLRADGRGLMGAEPEPDEDEDEYEDTELVTGHPIMFSSPDLPPDTSIAPPQRRGRPKGSKNKKKAKRS